MQALEERPAVSSEPSPSDIQKLQNTIRAYVKSWASNDSKAEASFYDETVRWCYAKSPSGQATRAQIQNSIRVKLSAYPRRSYKNIQVLEVRPNGPFSAQVRLKYDYEYLGKKNAHGSSEPTMMFSLRNGVWRISSWEEVVSPQ
jgi:uncharacterized protein (TIGR02246 family)